MRAKSIIGSEPVVKIGVGSANGSGAWAPPILSESWNSSGSKNVVVYTNCQSVELYLNGTKVGTKANPGLTAQFTMNWASGTLKVVGLNNGSQVAVDSIVSTGAAAKIVLKSDRTTLYADGDDVANIDAYIVDAAGRHIWSATNTLSYTVTGSGRGMGIGVGDLSKAATIVGTSRNAYEGRAYLPVQSLTTLGSITVTVSSNGLTAGTIVLATVPEPEKRSTISVRRSLGGGGSISSLRAGRHSIEMDYQLAKASTVRISVHLPNGRTVAEFDQGFQTSGQHSWTWNGIPGESAYLVRLQAGASSSTKLVVVP